MSEQSNGPKQPEKGQTTLQGQKTPSDHKPEQKQPGQDVKTTETGGQLKEQTNQNRPSEQR